MFQRSRPGDAIAGQTAPAQGGAHAEDCFQKAFENAPVGMALAHPDGRIARVNEAFCAVTGYPASLLEGKNFRDLIHPQDVEPSVTAVSRLLSGERRSVFIEKRYNRADGGWIEARTSVAVVREADRPRFLIVQIEDVTESKRRWRPLDESTARLQAVLDNSPAAVTMTDLDGRYILVNRMAAKVLGIPEANWIGKTAAELSILEPTHRADFDAVTAVDERVIASAQPVVRQHEVATPGGPMTLLTEKFPVRDAQGAVYAVAGVSVDITDRVAVEKENRRLEAELQEARRLETIGGLAGGIAHDFNNLLAVIINYAALAREEATDGSSIAEELDEIRDAAARAAELTRKLLVFSRQERVEPRTLDLNRVVRDAEWLLHRTLGEDIELWIELGDDLWPIEGDASQLEATLVNLAVNARHAMPRGGALTVRTENVALKPSEGPPTLSAGRYVRLAVADTGSGMDEEVAKRAFDPFFTTKAPGLGTGLGLATVHGIARQAGGAVELNSRPGGGTAVTLYVPASDRELAVEPPPADPAVMGAGDGEAILVVEDEPSVRRMVTAILARAGYAVQEASPMEALEACARPDTPADLLVTDVVMPSISGVELAARARDLSPGLRVLYMSGYVDEAKLESGTYDLVPLLQKPFTPERLVQAIETALREPLGLAAER